jgi:hypothetical protein
MNFLVKIRDWTGRQIKVHYSEDELLAFNDGECPPRTAQRITAHLDDCAQCRGVLAQLSRELRTLTRANSSPLHNGARIDDGLRALRSAIQDWNAAGRTEIALGSLGLRGMVVLTPQLRAELGIYLGFRATDLIFQEFIRTACSQRKITEFVESILEDFLGRRAGEALVRSLLPLPPFQPISYEGHYSRDVQS